MVFKTTSETSYLQTKRIDIALISKTHLTSRLKIYIPGLKLIDDSAHGGAFILIKSFLLYHSFSQYIEPHIQAYTIIVILNHTSIKVTST